MNNETNEPEILSENVKISFDNIANVYKESSFLLKDLVVGLEELGFQKTPAGDSIRTDFVSKNLNSPRYWLTRYAALSFRATAEPESNRLLYFSISYFDLEPKAVKPYLIIGVCEKFDGVNWDAWWMHSVFFNDDNMFRYYGNDNEILSIENPYLDWQSKEDEWGFKVPDGGTRWPRAGKLFAVPL